MSTLPIAGVHSLQDYVSPDFEADPQGNQLLLAYSSVKKIFEIKSFICAGI